jgi:D-threonate/D-erythronate kinase
MIAVIADDFTGAAEIASIALSYGLRATICFIDSIDSNAEVLIVCSNTRSMEKSLALQTTAIIIEKVLTLNPTFIYKKIDSVLRGYVVDEINVQLKFGNYNNALILPANPSLCRTIENDIYLINGKPIAETDFKNDPEFPIYTSNVSAILNSQVQVASHHETNFKNKLVVGEVKKLSDIDTWILTTNNKTLLAGGGDFFNAILKATHTLNKPVELKCETPFLYVCGTANVERTNLVKQLHQHNKSVFYLPQNMNDNWVDNVSESLKNTNASIVIAINETTLSPMELRVLMAEAVKNILDKCIVNEIFIEGGATAAEILSQLKINKLEAVGEWSRGVVKMKSNNFLITVKPGSYALPLAVQNILNK